MGSFRKWAGMPAFLAGLLLLGCQEISSTRCFTDCAHKPPGRTPDMKKLLGWELAGLPWREQLDSSRKALGILKDSMQDSYAYRTSFSSWTGYREATWITVRRGAVLERRFESGRFQHDSTRVWVEPLTSYHEKGAEVGRAKEGALPRILDSLYVDCRRTLESARDRDSIYFKLDTNYVVRECRYYPYGCADDCLRGFMLDTLLWGD